MIFDTEIPRRRQGVALAGGGDIDSRLLELLDHARSIGVRIIVVEDEPPPPVPMLSQITTSREFTLSCAGTFTDIDFTSRDSGDFPEVIRARFWRFLNSTFRQSLEPNPLPILARAVNAVGLRHRPIRQPCWRKGRWKSLT